jgi:elongation factor G
MKDATKVRNFVVAGHSGSGKTSLCDLMLFKAGAVDRKGSVDQKNSVSDYTPDEQEKQSSIYSTTMNCDWKDNKLFFIDTPGYGEFVGEAVAGFAASNNAMIVIDGVNGLETGSIRAMKFARLQELPRFIFINRLDREMSDFDRVLNQIQEAYGKTTCIPFTMPIGKENNFSQVVHVLRSTDIPAEIADSVAKYKEQLMDTIAESDEELMMRYLDGEELSEEEISSGLHKAIQAGDLVPIFAGSVEKDLGIDELMNGVVNLFSNPLAKGKITDKDGGEMVISADGAGVAQVFKSVVDPFIGQLTFLKVISGSLKSDTEVYNLSNGQKERFGQLIFMNGKNQTNTDEAVAGTMAAIGKLKNTHVSNTLCTASKGSILPEISFPSTVMSYAITAVKSGEEEKISSGLSKISESDPTVKIERNTETHELLLSGMGDQHLGNVVKKLKEMFKVEVNLASPKVPYRETITATGEAQYRHKKQSGGSGQFAEVHLRVAPIQEEKYEFANEVVGGNIPKNFIPAVEKGVVEAMIRGPLVGCVVENLKVTVYDGKHHPVDSNEMAFKIAARTAFRKAMESAKPVLLEPIMDVKIMIPNDYMGDISGDLNHKRGRILGMGVEEGMQVVNAEVPLAEMSRYATELRSMTQGRGVFEMEFARYETVPSNVANEIIAAFKAEEEED